jgi:hypothetical membrane protein
MLATHTVTRPRSGVGIPLPAAAGLLAPVWFTSLVVVQGRLQPDYSHVALPISALAAWPDGWVQTINFIVYAGLLAIFAAGLHRGIRPTPWGSTAPAAFAIAATGAIVAALFPWQRVNGVLVENGPHVAGAVMHFLGLSLGLVALSQRLARDPTWQGLARYTLINGLVLVVLFFSFGLFVLPDDAPLHPWAGLAQRIIVALWMTWMVAAAWRLRHLAVEQQECAATWAEGVRRQADLPGP